MLEDIMVGSLVEIIGGPWEGKTGYISQVMGDSTLGRVCFVLYGSERVAVAIAHVRVLRAPEVPREKLMHLLISYQRMAHDRAAHEQPNRSRAVLLDLLGDLQQILGVPVNPPPPKIGVIDQNEKYVLLGVAMLSRHGKNPSLEALENTINIKRKELLDVVVSLESKKLLMYADRQLKLSELGLDVAMKLAGQE